VAIERDRASRSSRRTRTPGVARGRQSGGCAVRPRLAARPFSL